jgi:hypothetical protein
MAHRFPVLPDGIEHDSEHSHKNDCAQNHHENVKGVLLFSNFGGSWMEIKLIDRWAAWQIFDGVSGSSHPSTGPNTRFAQQRHQCFGNALHSFH